MSSISGVHIRCPRYHLSINISLNIFPLPESRIITIYILNFYRVDRITADFNHRQLDKKCRQGIYFLSSQFQWTSQIQLPDNTISLQQLTMFYVTISKMLLRKAYNISAIKSQKYPVLKSKMCYSINIRFPKKF